MRQDDSREFDLSELARQGYRDTWNFRLVSAIALVGIDGFAISITAYALAAGPANIPGLAVFGFVIYVATSTFVDGYRMFALGPKKIAVSSDGLRFELQSGASVAIAWPEVPTKIRLFDHRGDARFPPSTQLHVFYDSGVWRMIRFSRPPMPRTYLTPEAFDALLDQRARTGLTAHRLAASIVLDRMDPVLGLTARSRRNR